MDIREKKIGFFGLGNMGLPMCQGMVKDGWKIVLPTFRPARTPEKQAAIDAMLAAGAEGAASQVEMIQKCDMFVLSLPKSQQVEALVLGSDGILANGKPGTIIVDATSADPMSTKKLAATLQASGMDIIDCPVSGGVGGAANQTLTIMVGGRKETFEYCLPILNTLGNPDKVMYIGPSGAGDMIKCAKGIALPPGRNGAVPAYGIKKACYEFESLPLGHLPGLHAGAVLHRRPAGDRLQRIHALPDLQGRADQPPGFRRVDGAEPVHAAPCSSWCR